ncbi:MAG: hypothetical protein FWF09_02200, partial [Bacteroidales bacterium]|nr:hypothetical protein [Bacteroidales bacterium]
MKYTKFTLFFTCALLLQAVSFKAMAQCSATITATAVQNSTCYNNGKIMVTVRPSDGFLLDDPLHAPDIKLDPIGTGVFLDWSKVDVADAPDYYLDALYPGTYEVSFRAFCTYEQDWFVEKAATTVTITGNYVPVDATAVPARKSLNCRPTGKVSVNFTPGTGTLPFTLEVTSFTPLTSFGYTLPTTPFVINSRDPFHLGNDDLPAGTYNFRIVDSCGSVKLTSANLGNVPDDIQMTLTNGLINTVDNTCARVRSSGFPNVNPTDFDWQWYWDISNRSTYFEVAYLYNDIGTPAYQPLAGVIPIYTLPNNYACFCESGDGIWLYTRIIGCTYEKSSRMSNGEVCLSTANTSTLLVSNGGNSLTAVGPACDSALLIANVSNGYAVCHPLTWTITLFDDPTGAHPIGTLIDTGTINEYGSSRVISNASGSKVYKRGNTYRITVTESGDCARTYIRDWTPSVDGGQTFIEASGTSLLDGTCRFTNRRIQAPENIKPGTQILYVSGPMDTLFYRAKGTPYIIPEDYGSNTFYFTVPPGAHPGTIGGTQCRDMLPGRYFFEVINDCGETFYYNYIWNPRYVAEPFDYTKTPTCSGLEFTLLHRIQRHTWSSTTNLVTVDYEPNGTWYNIISAPTDVVVDQNRYPYGGKPLVLPTPGRYIIGTSYNSAGGCYYRRDTIDITDEDFLWVDPESIARYVCVGTTHGHISVQATVGVPFLDGAGNPYYKYEIYAHRHPDHGGTDSNTDYQANTTGKFPYTGRVNNNYVVYVTDSCRTIEVLVTMLDLNNQNIAYTPESAYCEGNILLINSIPLGDIEYCNWIGPNGYSSLELRPRPTATTITPPPPDYGNGGWYSVSVKPLNCGEAYTGSIYVSVGKVVLDDLDDIEGPSVICLNNVGEQQFRVKLIDGVDINTGYEWSFPSGWTVTGQDYGSGYATVTAIPPAVVSNYTISVMASNDCSPTIKTQTKQVTITEGDAIPKPVIAPPPGSVCAADGTKFTVKVVPQPDVTYFWVVKNMWEADMNFTGQGTDEIEVTLGVMDIFVAMIIVTAEGDCGSGTADPVFVWLDSTVPGGLNSGGPSGPAIVCAGSDAVLQYSIPAISLGNAVVDWKFPTGWSDPTETGTSGSIFYALVTAGSGAESGYVEVRTRNGCGESEWVKFWVDVETAPIDLTGDITGNNAVCADLTDPIRYSITGDDDALDYTWTFPAGWLPSNPTATTATTTELYIDLKPTACSGKKTITVVANNSCDAGAALELEITVYDDKPVIPTNAITGNNEVCAKRDDSETYHQTYSVSGVEHATSYVWTIPAGWSVVGSSTGASITLLPPDQHSTEVGTGNITVAAKNACGTSTAEVFPVEVVNCYYITYDPGDGTGTKDTKTYRKKSSEPCYEIEDVPPTFTPPLNKPIFDKWENCDVAGEFYAPEECIDMNEDLNLCAIWDESSERYKVYKGTYAAYLIYVDDEDDPGAATFVGNRHWLADAVKLCEQDMSVEYTIVLTGGDDEDMTNKDNTYPTKPF